MRLEVARISLVCSALLGSTAALGNVQSFDFTSGERKALEVGPVTAQLVTTIDAMEEGNACVKVHLHNEAGHSLQTTVSYEAHRGDGQGSDATRRELLGPGESRDLWLTLSPGLRGGMVRLRVEEKVSQGEPFFVRTHAGALVLAVADPLPFTPPPVPATGATAVPPAFYIERSAASQLPLELTSYTAFSSVYLGSVGLEQLSEAQRQVLEAYVAIGGRLALGVCTPATAQYLPLLHHAPQRGETTAYGFGEVLHCGASPNSLAEFLSRTGFPTKHVEEVTVPRLLPESAPPVGRFFLIVLVFALTIGLGSIWLVRKRRTASLLVALPAAAAVTSAVMLFSALLGHGLHTLASARSVAFLDGERGRAISVGMTAFFAGRTSDSLAVSNTSAWFPDQISYFAEGGYTMTSGFIPPRRYVERRMGGVVPTRARLTVGEHDGARWVRNALGATVRHVYVVQGGALREASNVLEGAEGKTSAARSISWDSESLPIDAERINALRSGMSAGSMQEGEYLAVVEGPGFLPLGTLLLEHLGSEVWIRGRVQR